MDVLLRWKKFKSSLTMLPGRERLVSMVTSNSSSPPVIRHISSSFSQAQNQNSTTWQAITKTHFVLQPISQWLKRPADWQLWRHWMHQTPSPRSNWTGKKLHGEQQLQPRLHISTSFCYCCSLHSRDAMRCYDGYTLRLISWTTKSSEI